MILENKESVPTIRCKFCDRYYDKDKANDHFCNRIYVEGFADGALYGKIEGYGELVNTMHKRYNGRVCKEFDNAIDALERIANELTADASMSSKVSGN